MPNVANDTIVLLVAEILGVKNVGIVDIDLAQEKELEAESTVQLFAATIERA